ncbi:MAG: hypothetical protein RI841_16320 [Halomonas sp.]|nr:hypothetical protein [Halomonas sp.]MDR9441046.1 hypothetical protein [Halomonas sp.]
MTTDTIFLIFIIALCLVAIAGVIVGVWNLNRGGCEQDEHESTDDCRG